MRRRKLPRSREDRAWFGDIAKREILLDGVGIDGAAKLRMNEQ